MLNQVTLIGRPTKGPDVRYTQDGKSVARLNLAVDRMKEGADFISIVAFGKTAEMIEKYVFKGKLIGVVGRIQTGSYEGKDGKKVYTTDVVADRVIFLDKKSAETNDEPSAEIPEGFSRMDEEDIPFD